MHCSRCGNDIPAESGFCNACGDRTQRNETVALLIVLGIVFAIIAAIVLPNLLNAIDRGKQMRTLAEMRAIARAVGSYSVDVGHYPVSRSLEKLEVLDSVRIALEPKYSLIPTTDGWAGAYYYQTDPGGSSFTLMSYGKDKLLSVGSAGQTLGFDCDIIMSNGKFTAYPEGIQIP